MDNQPAFDRNLLIPILISGFSVIGIIVVLMIGRRLSAPAEIAVTPSATRFQYLYLGTEPAITTPLVEGSEFPLTEDPFEEPDEEEEPPNEPVIPASTPIVLATSTTAGNDQPTNTALPTTTSVAPPPLNAGTYDDIHASIIYNGWQPTISGGTTLHVSASPGSTASFRFIGRELRILYQSGATLGEVRITIDNVVGTLDQSNEANEWVSAVFENGTHTVVISHTGGGSVNLDQIIVPEVPVTATPTLTPTP